MDHVALLRKGFSAAFIRGGTLHGTLEPGEKNDIDGALLPALIAAHDGELEDFDLRWREEVALCVVMAAKGYPGTPAKGSEIRGLDSAAGADTSVRIFHAGTKRVGDKLVADGGRVLNVVARGRSVREAQKRAYAVVDKIDWPQGFCRRDIGWRAIGRRRSSAPVTEKAPQ